jgi:hypothetical protein
LSREDGLPAAYDSNQNYWTEDDVEHHFWSMGLRMLASSPLLKRPVFAPPIAARLLLFGNGVRSASLVERVTVGCVCLVGFLLEVFDVWSVGVGVAVWCWCSGGLGPVCIGFLPRFPLINWAPS